MTIRSFLVTGALIAGSFLRCVLPAQALDLPTKTIEDDSSLRLSLRPTWFTEAPDRVLNMKPFIHTLPGGGRIQVRTEAAKDEFLVILARERNGAYPGWAQGSWVLTRRRDNGNASRIRIFLRSDPYMYIQFRPVATDRCMMDIVVYDAYIIRSLPVPYAIDRLFVIPVEEALSAVGTQFPRWYFDPDPAMYRDLRTFISLLRQRLPELRYQDDGAIDEQGRYVYIKTLAEQAEQPGLNCSGFAKWVVDGLLRPFTGARLTIPPLKQPFGKRGSSLSEIYEPIRDPFFGLDWTRNLASIAQKRLIAPTFGNLAEIEVQKQSFSWINQRTKEGTAIRSYPDFLLNAGFSLEGLQPLLYTLALDEPGNIYLGSVNNERGTPRLREHFHVAILVPYFSEEGTFHIAVFESAEETSFTGFRNRYAPGHFVNLVRITVDPRFDP